MQIRIRALHPRPERRQLGLRLRQSRALGQPADHRDGDVDRFGCSQWTRSSAAPRDRRARRARRRGTPPPPHQRWSPAGRSEQWSGRRCRRLPEGVLPDVVRDATATSRSAVLASSVVKRPPFDQTHAERVEVVRRDDAGANRVAAVVVRQRQTREVDRHRSAARSCCARGNAHRRGSRRGSRRRRFRRPSSRSPGPAR